MAHRLVASSEGRSLRCRETQTPSFADIGAHPYETQTPSFADIGAHPYDAHGAYTHPACIVPRAASGKPDLWRRRWCWRRSRRRRRRRSRRYSRAIKRAIKQPTRRPLSTLSATSPTRHAAGPAKVSAVVAAALSTRPVLEHMQRAGARRGCWGAERAGSAERRWRRRRSGSTPAVNERDHQFCVWDRRGRQVRGRPGGVASAARWAVVCAGYRLRRL